MRKRALTLVELLVVIAIIAIVAAILFPIVGRAKRSAQQSACSSNLAQIGKAIGLYMSDADDKWPFGIDPADKFTPQIWRDYPEFQRLIPSLPLMHDLLYSYTGNYAFWKCPSDKGQIVDDISFEVLVASPTSFEQFGTSYYYRTEVTVRQLSGTSITDPTSINIYFDGSGAWHTAKELLEREDSPRERSEKLRDYRYNVLFGDLHVKSIMRDQYTAAWDTKL